MEYQVNNDSLIHYGVPGMKWGVRHDKPSAGGTRMDQIRTKNAGAEYAKLYRQNQSLAKSKKITRGEATRRNMDYLNKAGLKSNVKTAETRAAAKKQKALDKYNKSVAKADKRVAATKQTYSRYKANSTKANSYAKNASRGEQHLATLTGSPSAYYLNRASGSSKGSSAVKAMWKTSVYSYMGDMAALTKDKK